MKIVLKGSTRIVILVGPFAIKIPRYLFRRHSNFLSGCLANWRERRTWKIWREYCPEKAEKIVPIYFCFAFRFLQISKKVKTLDRKLSVEERKEFEGICEDFNENNFGVLKDRIVCVDFE